MSGMYAAIAGMAVSAYGKMAAGNAKKNALYSSAAMLDQEAGQSVASGIQGSIEERRRAAYVASNARAATAASGLATTGTSAIANTGLIEGEGEYRARTALYQGEDRANELNFRASGMRNEGGAAETAGYIGAASTVLSGGTDFYTKYGDAA